MNTRIPRSRKAQIFSIDVLVAIMPFMMIIGAGLQYLFIAQEDMKDLARRDTLDTLAESFSDYVFYDKSFNITPDICQGFEDKVNDSRDANSLGSASGYIYHVRIRDYFDVSTSNDLCHDETLWTASLAAGRDENYMVSNTASSVLRFMVESDSSGNLEPGKIAGVSFSVWEDI